MASRSDDLPFLAAFRKATARLPKNHTGWTDVQRKAHYLHPRTWFGPAPPHGEQALTPGVPDAVLAPFDLGDHTGDQAGTAHHHPDHDAGQSQGRSDDPAGHPSLEDHHTPPPASHDGHPSQTQQAGQLEHSHSETSHHQTGNEPPHPTAAHTGPDGTHPHTPTEHLAPEHLDPERLDPGPQASEHAAPGHQAPDLAEHPVLEHHDTAHADPEHQPLVQTEDPVVAGHNTAWHDTTWHDTANPTATSADDAHAHASTHHPGHEDGLGDRHSDEPGHGHAHADAAHEDVLARFGPADHHENDAHTDQPAGAAADPAAHPAAPTGGTDENAPADGQSLHERLPL